jgi:hypothetical protein
MARVPVPHTMKLAILARVLEKNKKIPVSILVPVLKMVQGIT